MRFYLAVLPLSTQTLDRVAGLIRSHRRAIGSRWRTLNAGEQALLTLVYLRKGERFADLAAGFGISTATAWRRARETIRLPAARCPLPAARCPLPVPRVSETPSTEVYRGCWTRILI